MPEKIPPTSRSPREMGAKHALMKRSPIQFTHPCFHAEYCKAAAIPTFGRIHSAWHNDVSVGDADERCAWRAHAGWISLRGGSEVGRAEWNNKDYALYGLRWYVYSSFRLLGGRKRCMPPPDSVGLTLTQGSSVGEGRRIPSMVCKKYRP